MSRSQKIEKRYRQRSVIILLNLQGEVLEEIIKKTGLNNPVVNKWRQGFRRYGLKGRKDVGRSGKPSVITAKQKALVVQKTCGKPNGGYTNWSQKRIAQQVGISQSKVHQILKQADLKPHKIK